MSNSPSTRCVSAEEGYRLWSRVYDSQPNPMLSLEQRYLELLLPSIAGLDVVDLGCGTGRWLEKFAAKKPRTLVGMDSSAEMLARAAEKISNRAMLIEGNCEKPSLPSSSADLIMCSFLASYISGLDTFAEEIHRVARPGADISVTDLHPLTETSLGWQRGFRVGDTHFNVATLTWSLAQLLSCFKRVGLKLATILEPSFGEPEFSILERAGKSGSSRVLRKVPAIYILQFRRPRTSSNRNVRANGALSIREIRGARVGFGPRESAAVDIHITGDRVEFLGRPQSHSSPTGATASTPNARSSALDLTGYLVLPGLINAHDHLEFALFPRLRNRQYNNFAEWADDIHHPESSPVREHRAVPKETRLWWGGIRNLLSGVTTVCHHNPYDPAVFEVGFPVRVLREFGWAHSLTLDPGAPTKFKETSPEQPFILHLAEGVDSRSAREIFDLHDAEALDGRTVVVHGLALDASGIALLKSRGASLIWCPTSNVFLFGKTHSSEVIEGFPSIALGSDSPLTAQGDLLDELCFARDHVGIAPEALFSQVTTRAAQILRLKDGEGSLRVGAFADLIAVRDKGLTPAETLASSTYRDIELVLLAGRVQLASPEFLQKLPSRMIDGLEPLDVDGHVRWIRAPVANLITQSSSILGNDLLLGGRKVKYEHAT
jgi:cytosine/adenosine deaminase-related metal-dependent hydrolase/SAM-dependent methyltransferase